jgi:hypothetical protein
LVPALIPLSVSCRRISVSDVGCGSELLTGPTLTPAGSLAGCAVGAAAPATGSIACGRAWSADPLELGAEEAAEGFCGCVPAVC